MGATKAGGWLDRRRVARCLHQHRQASQHPWATERLGAPWKQGGQAAPRLEVSFGLMGEDRSAGPKTTPQHCPARTSISHSGSGSSGPGYEGEHRRHLQGELRLKAEG
jgi:hypothetical protein